jgi:hypothetical protein
LNPTEAWRYKKIKRELAAAHNCAYVDIDSIWGENPVASPNGLMFNGNRHPSADAGGAGGGDGHANIGAILHNIIKAGTRS